MRNEAGAFLDNLIQIQNDREYVSNLGTEIGPEYSEMIEGQFGDEIVESGLAMLAYLFDLMNKDIRVGMAAYKILFMGYDDIPHSDLLGPYYDSVTTRNLFIRLSESNFKPSRDKAISVMNIYLRWYTATYELFRKMLVFDCYCHGIKTEKPININRYLFQNNDPAKLIANSGSGKILLKRYDPAMRHAIAHGNTIFIPGKFIIVRMTNDEKNKIIENRYDNADAFIDQISPSIEVMNNTIRFFFFITMNLLLPKYSKIFNTYIRDRITSETLIAVVKSIQG